MTEKYPTNNWKGSKFLIRSTEDLIEINKSFSMDELKELPWQHPILNEKSTLENSFFFLENSFLMNKICNYKIIQLLHSLALLPSNWKLCPPKHLYSNFTADSSVID